MMKKTRFMAVVALVLCTAMVFAACSTGGAKTEQYPSRPINLIIPFGAGGGTDVWNRALAAEMEKTLGVKVLANNMAGGGPGGTGTNYVWTQPHDGYAIAGTSETPLTIPVMTKDMNQTAKDWEYYIAGGSPGLLLVNKNSGYKEFQSLIDAANLRPNQIKIACTNGGLWFLLGNLLPAYGNVPLGVATYDGSRPAITACVSGETAAVVASAGEVADFIKSGDLIPLAVMDKEGYDFPSFGKIDSVTAKVPSVDKYLPLKQFIGFMVPKDTPDNVKAKLKEAFDAAMKSEEIKKFADAQYAVVINLTGEDARNLASKAQSTMCWMLSDMGKTERSPEETGIPKP